MQAWRYAMGFYSEAIMIKAIRKFVKEEEGVTALEYGLLAAVVAGIIVAAFQDPLHTFFDSVFTKVNNAAGTAGG